MSDADEIRMVACETHGEYRSRLDAKSGRWSRCWGCVEAELLALDSQARAKEAAEQRALELERHLAESGMEGRLLAARFSNFIARTPAQQKVLDACQSFVEPVEADACRNLWLVGGVGVGKTHLGAAMVSHFIRERGMPAALLSAREVIRQMRANWGRSKDARALGESEEEVVERLGRVGLLVLDEIGAGFDSDADRVQLFDVIDLRYRLGLPTVVLSNLVAKDMKPILGERTYDRLREGASLLTCNWSSNRVGGQ